ncbi:MAG TPA: ParB/RepB/Spo0J family partition protein [Vicinamibacterales bacterium]|jgi:ParB family chromosome partitioning protein
MADKRPALGRGLSALIPDLPPAAPAAGERALDVDLDQLRPNRFQPRTQMDDERIDELSRSIRSNGIIQPIVVRRVAGEAERYEIIAGERRWRAAQRAGLMKVPVVVRDIPENRLLAVALIENIQRENLNPIEEAVAYRRLADDYQLTQEQIADAVGKDRSSIANYVRLLRLPQEVRNNLASNALSMGHARALLALPDEAAQLRLGRDIVARNLSVRDVEALVKKDTKEAKDATDAKERADPNTRAAEDKLRLALGTRVRINRRGKGGRIEIDFVSEDELQRIYERLIEE